MQRTSLAEAVSGFAALDAAAFGLRVGWLVPRSGTSCTLVRNL